MLANNEVLNSLFQYVCLFFFSFIEMIKISSTMKDRIVEIGQTSIITNFRNERVLYFTITYEYEM